MTKEHHTPKNLFVRSLIVLAVAVLLLWAWHRTRRVTVDSGFEPVMGTFARIVVVAENERTGRNAIAAAFSEIRNIEARMSDYDPNSLLSEVNRRAFREPVPVDSDLFTVLAASIEYSRLSDGAFDITVGPVVQLWRQAKQTGTAPDPAALQQARSRVGWRHLILDPAAKTVRFAVEGMALDLGGIAKGYAIDKAVTLLRASAVSGGMVDIGGDLRCFGTPPDNAAHWLIGVQDPACDENILLKLKMDDRAVASSGDYRRFVIIDGVKHSHIVDPATADSAQTLAGVSIIAASAMQADALATAVSVLGNEQGMAFIESIPEVEAVLIPHTPNPEIQTTPAAEQYIQN